MTEPKTNLLMSVLLFFGITSFVFAAETITIDTYYPSPYGIYDEMRAKRIAVGDNYSLSSLYCWPPAACVNLIGSNADLVVEGKVGIGNFSPAARLDVKGETSAIGAYGLGVRNSSDAYALIVRDDGNVGVGTITPASKLDVSGTVNMTGFRMPTGADAGKVLTSDASGVGSWGNNLGNIPCETSTPHVSEWLCLVIDVGGFIPSPALGFYCKAGTVTGIRISASLDDCTLAPPPP